jgi:hypothetical protein
LSPSKPPLSYAASTHFGKLSAGAQQPKKANFHFMIPVVEPVETTFVECCFDKLSSREKQNQIVTSVIKLVQTNNC